MKQEEQNISLQVAEYLKLRKILYRFDLAADLKLTMGQAMRMKKLQMDFKGYPDLFLCEPRVGYHGMYIELKKNKSEVFLKDGITYKKKKIKRGNQVYDHIQEQVLMQERLRDKGYFVVWGFGFEDTVEKIDLYLSGKC